MLKKFAKKILRSHVAIRFFYATGIYGMFFRRKYATQKTDYWENRTQDVLNCPDNKDIVKVPGAGKLIGNYQVMHNGVKILFGSYYGVEMVRLLEQNGGVHEPQEEKVFADVVHKMPPGAVMIELGSYWSFYSMWFQSVVKNAVNYMVEPDYFCYMSGRHNFKLNKMKGDFTNAFVSYQSTRNGSERTICIDDFAAEKKIEYIHLLHCDIQGHEADMLRGAKRMLDEKRIGCLFISTHSNILHDKCLEVLKQYQFRILASANLDQSYSWDGVLIAASPKETHLTPVSIALKGS